LTIRIEITAETPEQYGALVLALAGGARLEETLRSMIAGFLDATEEQPVETVWQASVVREPEPAAAHPDEGGPATPVEPTPAKPRRRTKAEIEAAKAADAPAPLADQVVNRAISETPEDRTGPQDTPVAEQPTSQPEPTIESVTLSHDDIRRALKAIVDAKGMPVATKALMDLGYGKTSDVPVEKIGEVIAALQQVAA